MKKQLSLLISSAILLTCISCNSKNSDLVSELSLTDTPKPATDITTEINSAVYSKLDFSNTSEYECATKNLIDAPEELELTDKDGNVIWSQKAYAFLDDYEKAPDSVNPSLWENSVNNSLYGLFEVTDGIYQVRGYDMANLTLIKSDTGWIVFDPLMSIECTQAAMELVEKNLGKFPVKAVIISHSHVDHYGGIKGLMKDEQAADPSLPIEKQISGDRIPIIVPEGFTEHAVSENVYSGKAMSRRANYQYGTLLEPSEKGKLAMGIGMGQSLGTVSFIAPTYEIKETGEKLTIDGIELEFQMTPGTEAPAEMNTWLPQKKALWVAENCTGTLHNLYTLRGAQIRDGNAWAKYLTEAITLYGDKAEVVFQSHNWPHWGKDTVNEYLSDTAAVYKYINDQTLTYINQGYTSDEISNMIELPDELAQNWYTRQYYGTVAHNSKAVYQKYMGWYDANPVNLNPLEPSESAKKWVEYLGDTDEVLKRAKEDFNKGEYQWVAEITNTIVFAEPENKAARLLCADALEQLGYQSESGTWRNAYLTAAAELRQNNLATKANAAKSTGDIQKEMKAYMLFDYMAILLDKPALANENFKINFYITDTKEQYVIHIKNGAILTYDNTQSSDAVLTISTPTSALFYILNANTDGIKKTMKLEGDEKYLKLLTDNMTEFSTTEPSVFNIIEP